MPIVNAENDSHSNRQNGIARTVAKICCGRIVGRTSCIHYSLIESSIEMFSLIV